MKIAQLTDLHLDDFLTQREGVDGRDTFLAVLDDVVRRGLRRVVLTGDLGEPASLSWLARTLTDRGLEAWAIPGNHDEPTDLAQVVPRQPTLPFAEEWEGKTVLFLGSHTNRIEADQQTWLKEHLAQGSSETLVFVHHPVLDCGQSSMDRLYPLRNRDEVRTILETSGKRVHLFCGHYHRNHSQTVGNITQHVTPSTAVQTSPDGDEPVASSDPIGYRIIEIGPDVRSVVVELQKSLFQ